MRDLSLAQDDPRPSPDDTKLFGLKDLLDLPARVVGPCADRIHLCVSAPVGERPARTTQAFEGERQIVMSVGVAGRDCDGLAISFHRFREASSLIEDVAEIEV